MLFSALLAPPSALAQAPHAGKATYDKWCAGCHGDTGAGDGSAAATMLPRPRDFTRGVYKIRTTASGEIPSDADIKHVIDEGMPGTAMPAWKETISEDERVALVAYLKTFSDFFKDGKTTLVSVGDAPGGGAEAIAGGRATYQKLECFKCHGQQGRGDGTSTPTLKDDWGHPIRAADLSERWNFRGGGTVEQIYTRLRTGLDGTPMPSFQDAIDQKLITDAQLWQLAQYVHSLSGEPPKARDVVRAARVQALPRSVDDTSWNGVERFFVPLVGQVVVKPRWFAPTVDGVWVQALHDGTRLALRLAWHDPSKSPDASWDEWLGRVAKSVTDADGAIAVAQQTDRVTVQLPARTSGDETELPFFLGGTARRPVQLWRWTATPDRVEVGNGTGLGTFAAASGSPAVTHSARYDAGEWRLMLVREIAVRDTTKAPAFVPGRATPVAFQIADGSNGEDAMRTAVSAWYSIYLDVPTPTVAYAAPVATVLLTAGFGMLLIVRAQRRQREAGTAPSDDPGPGVGAPPHAWTLDPQAPTREEVR